jgi:hypothetical protein
MNDALATATYWAPWLETVADIAFAVVIVALAVELVSGRIARRFERQIDAARELQIAQLNNETERLRKQIAPRSVGREFEEVLKGAPTSAIEILYAREAADGWTFAMQLWGTFIRLGWPVLPNMPQVISVEDGPTKAALPASTLPSAMSVCGNPIDITIVAPGKPREAEPNSSDISGIEKNPTSLGAVARAFIASLKAGTLTGQVAFSRCADVPESILKLRAVPANTIRIVIAPKR